MKVRDTASAIFLAQLNFSFQELHIIEVTRRDFNNNHHMQVLVTWNEFGMMGMMSQIAEKVGIDYSEVPDSRYVAQPMNDFLFLWEEKGYVEKRFYSERMRDSRIEPVTLMRKPSSETPVMETRPALRSFAKFFSYSRAF